MHAAGGRKRVRSTRSASTVSDSSETAVASADAATEATVDATTDTAASTPTADTATADLAHTAPLHTPAHGTFDDGNGRGKRSKTRRGGAFADTVKVEDSTAINGHTAAHTVDDDRFSNTTTATPAVPPSISTTDTSALRQATRSPSTTHSPPATPLATQGASHQVVHSDPPDPRSVPPTHPLNVGAAIPVHPTFPSSSRGYVAYFYWKHYPPIKDAVNPLPHRPSYTELVPSIPTIFYKILAILSDNEYNLYEHEALALMDKKLFKPTSPPPTSPSASHHPPLHHVYHRHVLMHPTDVPVDELDATKLVLRDHKGGEYVVTACRKEHVRLLYETDASVLGRLGVCPLFLDVYSVQGGKKALVGGAGNERRNRGGGDGWVCTCAEGAVPIVKREEPVAITQPPATKVSSAGRQGRAEAGLNDDSIGEQEEDVSMEDEQQADRDGEADVRVKEERDVAAAGAASVHETAVADSLVPSLTTSPAHPYSSELDVSGGDPVDDDLLLPADLLTPVHSTTAIHPSAGPHLATTPTSSYHPPPHIHTAFLPSSASSLSDADRDKQKRKLHAMQRQLSSVSDQLKSVTAMSNMWEAKYKEEKDVNEKLWARIVKVQRQLRQMSRPLTTALASQGRL